MPHADHLSSPATTSALEQLVSTQLRRSSTKSLLATLLDATRQVLPAGSEASVTLLSSQRPRTAATTGQRASTLDRAQYTSGDGPCLHSASTGDVVDVRDARTDPRWAAFTAQAVDHGILSSLSLPLTVTPAISGSLNVYAPKVDAFTDDTRSALTVLTAHTATVLGNLVDYQTVRSQARSLRVAVDRDAAIDQATGMLIERNNATPAVAHRILTEAAAASGISVHHAAAALLKTGELPGPARD